MMRVQVAAIQETGSYTATTARHANPRQTAITKIAAQTAGIISWAKWDIQEVTSGLGSIFGLANECRLAKLHGRNRMWHGAQKKRRPNLAGVLEILRPGIHPATVVEV